MSIGIYLRTEIGKLNQKIAQNKRRNNPADDIERFWSYLDIKGLFDCWNWKGALQHGYGRSRFNGKLIKAHRLAYKLYYGKIPDGKQINHRCHNRKCCNPFHLYVGTQQDNVNDMIMAGRQSRGITKKTAKQTEESIICIRILYQADISQSELAKMYRIGKSNINQIVHRRTWTHI